METACIVLGAVGYACMIGVTNAVFRWFYPPGGTIDSMDLGVGAVFWPVSLPAVLAFSLTRRVFGHVDAKREAAAREAADMKRRIAELDEELRVSKEPPKEKTP